MYPSNVDYDCTLLECHVDLDLEGFKKRTKRVKQQGLRYLTL